SGSAGVNLVTAESATVRDTEVTVIATTAKGPLGHGLSALLLGRSSATKQGIFVQPGVIDSDYCGQIKVMVRVLAPPMFIPKGSIIAQLVPFESRVPNCDPNKTRKDKGFGSTGPLVAFTEILSSEKPVRNVTLAIKDDLTKYSVTRIEASMMLDTGSDITIVP
ncbi:POK9 protein, partial [Tachuris rubrigastra]|nr:POK9 protein [Tachuris rubrigastra]